MPDTVEAMLEVDKFDRNEEVAIGMVGDIKLGCDGAVSVTGVSKINGGPLDFNEAAEEGVPVSMCKAGECCFDSAL